MHTIEVRRSDGTMLFLELFPAFVALIGLVVGIWLFVMNRQASREHGEDSDAEE